MPPTCQNRFGILFCTRKVQNQQRTALAMAIVVPNMCRGLKILAAYYMQEILQA